MAFYLKHVITAASLVALLGAGATAGGGPADRDAEQTVGTGSGPLLAGPKVEEEAKSEAVVTRMGEQGRVQEMPVPPLVWMRLARSVELDEAQSDRFDQIVDSHRQAMRKFREENGDALRAIQEGLREARQAQDRSRTRELLVKAQELRAKGPNPLAPQELVWELLTPAQQESLRGRLNEWREERAQQLRERLDRDRSERTRPQLDRPSRSDIERNMQRRSSIGEREMRRPARLRDRESNQRRRTPQAD